MKRIIAIALCVCTVAAAFSVDGGALLRGYGEFSGTDFNKKLFRFDGSGWMRTPLTKNGNLVLSAEACYGMEYGTDGQIAHTADLSLFKLGYAAKIGGGNLNVSAGRFSVSDVSGIVFNQPADGVAAAYRNYLLSVTAAANYTGLINSRNTTMIPVPAEPIENTAVYALSVPLVSGMASVSFPELFANQTLSVGIQGYCGIRKIDYQRIYATLSVNGPLSANLFYTASATGEMLFGDTSSPYAGLYGSAELAYYPPVLAAKIALRGESASKNFDTITKYSVSVSDDPCTNITKFGVSGSLNIKAILVLANAHALFTTSSMDYRGFQLDGGTRWQIVSDVQLGASAGYLFPSGEQDGYGKISINALIAL
ncbi:hypothetical protein [Treponema brennaborense]|uniref:Uncharacterized protein n=1 Tax=Treponema brennaborense (strain DSM 12168 / CIP 105900 / DD5/3) TaxID=906968 RepID=F4LM79_TREBD|nr:hypothetical protein [Treponema brennaborense]AEE17745.1 hypothetical protein Trebr_2336 [Treponema brennaborense DSM 12168]